MEGESGVPWRKIRAYLDIKASVDSLIIPLMVETVKFCEVRMNLSEATEYLRESFECIGFARESLSNVGTRSL